MHIKEKKIVYWFGCMFLGISCLFQMEARISCQNLYMENQLAPIDPAFHFGIVQRACLEIGTDLDVVHSTPELQKAWTTVTDHLIEQFLKLYTSIANLISDKKEARSYLLEDAIFLIDLMDLIHKKYERLVLSDPDIEERILACLTILMEKSKKKISELLKFNQEIASVI